MPSDYTINGVDLDTLFKARSSTKRADIGIRVGGVDISNRYEPTNGSDQITTNTDIKINNTDLRYVFQKYDYAPPVTSADYLIISYNWTSANGTDLDGSTNIESPVTTADVGYGQAVNGAPPYLYWSGDNTYTGAEYYYVDLRQFADTAVVKIRCAAWWWEIRGNGNVLLKAEASKGGAIVTSGTTDARVFTNPTGTVTASISVTDNVLTLSESVNPEFMRFVIYNKSDNSLTFSTV